MVNSRRVPATPRHTARDLGSDDTAQFQPRAATAADLDTVNRVVIEAVTSWGLPGRVHRLATSALTYDATDLAHMSIALLTDANGNGVGVAAWEEASRHQAPHNARAVLLHGLYVVPRCQRIGTGTRLAELVLQWAADRGFDGVVVRAWRDALQFFCSIGFEPIAGADQASQYPRQLWKAVQAPSRHEPALPASAGSP